MKTTTLKSTLLKSGFVIAVVAIGTLGYLKSTTTPSDQAVIKLKDLSRISNANAEGSVSCSGDGSTCSFTLNGEYVTVEGKRN